MARPAVLARRQDPIFGTLLVVWAVLNLGLSWLHWLANPVTVAPSRQELIRQGDWWPNPDFFFEPIANVAQGVMGAILVLVGVLLLLGLRITLAVGILGAKRWAYLGEGILAVIALVLAIGRLAADFRLADLVLLPIAGVAAAVAFLRLKDAV